jgi:molybdopterin biosynthesis enzyme MoaB
MLIKIGLLCIPEFDPDACAIVRRALLQRVPDSVVTVESSIGAQRNWIEETLRRWCDEEELDLILTIGGTLPAPGPSADEITPEATLAILDRQMPSLSEAMRNHAQKVTHLALLDRGVAGIRSRTLIVNLPAGDAPALLFLRAIIGVLGAIVAHLQNSATLAPHIGDDLEIIDSSADEEVRDASVQATLPGQGKLKAEEFAAFLQRGANQKPRSE